MTTQSGEGGKQAASPITNPSFLLAPVPIRTVPLKEFFDLITYCGDFASTGYPIDNIWNLRSVYGRRGCGARNWRVIHPNLFRRNEHIIICRECGLKFAVEREVSQ